jgi:hypothetical protein
MPVVWSPKRKNSLTGSRTPMPIVTYMTTSASRLQNSIDPPRR